MGRIPLIGFHSLRAAIAALLLMPALASSQDVSEAALKAAFIYNFAKFTEWPIDAAPAGGPLVMCVVGDDAVGQALERAVKNRQLAGHSISVSYLAPSGTSQLCHVFYVTGVSANQAAEIVAGLRDEPVLTISDIEGFTRFGGIAQLFFEYGQLRFRIQNESARRAGLQISAKLLTLAKVR